MDGGELLNRWCCCIRCRLTYTGNERANGTRVAEAARSVLAEVAALASGLSVRASGAMAEAKYGEWFGRESRRVNARSRERSAYIRRSVWMKRREVDGSSRVVVKRWMMTVDNNNNITRQRVPQPAARHKPMLLYRATDEDRRSCRGWRKSGGARREVRSLLGLFAILFPLNHRVSCEFPPADLPLAL